MAMTTKEKLRINVRANRVLGKRSASDRRIFMQMCIDQLTESGEASGEDDARDICEMLYEEGTDISELE